MSQPRTEHDPQEHYARWLELGSRLVFVFGCVALGLYLTGVLPALVPVHDLPHLWTLPAGEFLRATHAPAGFDWIGFLRYGDYLNVAAIAGFSLLSMVCTVRVVPAFLKNGERLHALLAALEALVLLAAALNLFPGAH